jgi:ABC-type Fe3+/spermidine/putrescine transport system ATPase subunit
MSRPLAVEVNAVTKLYGPRPALNGLSFALPLGSLGGLAGPNGAGKTTALRVLLGIVRPTGAAATVLGHSIAHPERYLARVGALIEGPAFHPGLTGRRNLQVLARLGGVVGSVVDSVLDQVGLAGRAGSVDELLEAARQPALVARAEVVFDTPRLVELCAGAGYPASVADGWVHICAPTAWAGELNRRAMRDGITLVRLGTTQRSLEDAFLDLTEASR